MTGPPNPRAHYEATFKGGGRRERRALVVAHFRFDLPQVNVNFSFTGRGIAPPHSTLLVGAHTIRQGE